MGAVWAGGGLLAVEGLAGAGAVAGLAGALGLLLPLLPLLPQPLSAKPRQVTAIAIVVRFMRFLLT